MIAALCALKTHHPSAGYSGAKGNIDYHRHQYSFTETARGACRLRSLPYGSKAQTLGQHKKRLVRRLTSAS